LSVATGPGDVHVNGVIQQSSVSSRSCRSAGEADYRACRRHARHTPGSSSLVKIHPSLGCGDDELDGCEQWLSKTSTRSGSARRRPPSEVCGGAVERALVPLFSSRRRSSGSTMVGTCASSPLRQFHHGVPSLICSVSSRIEVERVLATSRRCR